MSAPNRTLSLLLLSVLPFFSCTPDPVHDRAVEALGEESPAGPSEFHRAGQPCTTCHEAEGPAKSDFSVAGTVFDGPTSLVGIEGARIELRDADGSMPAAVVQTNCVGNFFVLRKDWQPRFPIEVRVVKGDTSRLMESRVGATASCADCHSLEGSPPGPVSKVAPVFLFDGPDPAGHPASCPVDPRVVR